jgi:hypothetical protein
MSQIYTVSHNFSVLGAHKNETIDVSTSKLDKEKNQCIREKNRSREYSKVNKTARKSGYNTYRGWTQTGYLNKHYNISQKTKTHRSTEEEMEGPILF